MEQATEDTRRMYSVITQLVELHINTPDVVVYMGSQDADRNKLIAEKMCEAIKKHRVKTVLRRYPGEPVKYLKHDEALTEIAKLEDCSKILILRAPDSKPLVTGVCKVSILFGEISIDGGDSYRTAWRDKITHPMAEYIYMVTRTIGPHAKSLDGLRLIWSYHEKSEGHLRDKLMFWGM